MIEDVVSRIRSIFVGRHSELQRLKGLWNLACQDEEHLVYVFLNAPGVGKTTLINFFGKSIDTETIGLFIKFVCNSDYDSSSRLNKNLIKVLDKEINQKSDLIERFIAKKSKKENIERLREKFKRLQGFINELLMKSIITLNDINDVFLDLAEVIPIFFAADEIQEFQKVSFKREPENSHNAETALHYFTRILKNLLNSRILLVLSGTRYHILSQIGADIGSPIRQKVRPLIIQKFEREEVLAYVDEVKNLIDIADIKSNDENILVQLKNYKHFLFAFSGGHPRTIENITDHFLNYLHHLLSDDKYLDYNVFIDFLLPKLEEFFTNSLLSSSHKEMLTGLAIREEFSVIKEWILSKASQGQFLGERPKDSENTQSDDEIRRIVYELMNLGIIVQNGNYNYHLTSYFHFLEFLKLYNEPYEQFLKEVLHNKHFKLMCGFHSGFGYTFENIFTSALITRGAKIRQEIPINLKLNNLRSLKVLKGRVDWSELEIKSNILYQTPLAEVIDGLVFQENELFLIQITTANPPNPLKKDALISEIEAISRLDLKAGKYVKISGWLVSLFKFQKELPSHENFLITDGDKLIPIIGKELYLKLKAVKKSFN